MSKSTEYSFRGNVEYSFCGNEYFLHTLVDTRVNSSVMLFTFSGPRNDLLSVAIRRNMSDVVQVLCRPLTRFEGRASCEVAYSTIPNTENMVKSESVGGARDIITVLLMSTAGPEATLTVAAATRGGKQDVVVEGTFETGIEIQRVDR